MSRETRTRLHDDNIKLVDLARVDDADGKFKRFEIDFKEVAPLTRYPFKRFLWYCGMLIGCAGVVAVPVLALGYENVMSGQNLLILLGVSFVWMFFAGIMTMPPHRSQVRVAIAPLENRVALYRDRKQFDTVKFSEVRGVSYGAHPKLKEVGHALENRPQSGELRGKWQWMQNTTSVFLEIGSGDVTQRRVEVGCFSAKNKDTEEEAMQLRSALHMAWTAIEEGLRDSGGDVEQMKFDSSDGTQSVTEKDVSGEEFEPIVKRRRRRKIE